MPQLQKSQLLVLLVTVIVTSTLFIPVSTRPAQATTDELNTTVDDNWHENSDLIVWVAADSQPDPGDNISNFERLNNTVDDLNNLPFTPNYTVLPGDIADPKDVGKRSGDAAAIRNIKRTRDAYERLRWFEPGVDNNTLILRGNHESDFSANYSPEFSQHFGGQCDGADRLVTMNTQTNLQFAGLCGTGGDDYGSYTRSMGKLDTHLGNLEQEGSNTNVITALHQPIPNTVTNDHSINSDGAIYDMDAASEDKYRSITSQYGNSTLSATLTGHLHGRLDDSGDGVNTYNGQQYVQTPVFGDSITHLENGTSTGRGVGDSMFLSFEYGSDTAEVYVRRSCNDYDEDGICDGTAQGWVYKFPIYLDHPLEKPDDSTATDTTEDGVSSASTTTPTSISISEVIRGEASFSDYLSQIFGRDDETSDSETRSESSDSENILDSIWESIGSLFSTPDETSSNETLDNETDSEYWPFQLTTVLWCSYRSVLWKPPP